MSWDKLVMNASRVWETLQDIHFPVAAIQSSLQESFYDIELPGSGVQKILQDVQQHAVAFWVNMQENWKEVHLPTSSIHDTIHGIRLPAFAILLLLAPLIPVFSYVFYYAFLHPLAKYPGPFWGKFTGARAAYHAWIGDVHIDMWRCHQKYGPYVRYSPNYLLCNTTEAFKDIYGRNKNVQKSLPYQAMVHNTPSTFTLLDKHEHTWKKRILSHRLSDGAIRSFEPKVSEIVDRFCAALCATASATTWSEPLNMSHWCDYLFFDLVMKIVFGENFNLIESPWYRHIPHALASSNERMSVIVQFPYVVYRRMDKLLFRDSVYGRKDFLRFVHNLVTERIGKGSKDDVFSGLLDAVDPGTGNTLTQDEIIAESILMLVAGSDTSSTLLAAVFFYLTHNTDKMKRVVDEVRGQFTALGDVHMGPRLHACRYLHACVSESLRMAPPVAAAPFREVTKGGLVVEERVVPEGVNIGTGLFAIQHNERYFHDPFEFLPERWLPDEKGPCQVHDQEAYVPFSMGPRVCLGKGLALAEVSFALARICWSLDFEVVESMKAVGAGDPSNEYGRHRPGEFQLYDHITCTRNGPMVHFRPRSRS